jgi:alkylation response protein AidB-like acyl-CoA dehydrogenase
MNGGATFNEVFFDDVRVPHEQVLGDVNEGWTVAITTLMNERVAIGSGGGGGGRSSVHDVIDLARERGANTDARVRQQLAGLYTKTRISRFLSMRTLTAASQGKIPGPEGSIGSCWPPHHRAGRAHDARRRRRGRGRHPPRADVLMAPASHIAGGSDEVMKNIIGSGSSVCLVSRPTRASREGRSPVELRSPE